MPNGDPDWRKKELPKLKVFFKRIAPVLKKFAKDHNLKIGKYFHQGSCWDFTFRHPECGVGKIEVQKSGGDHVMIFPMWWVDYYDSLRRDFKEIEGIKSSLESEALRTRLDEALKQIISWRKEDLTEGPENPGGEHIEMTKEKFDQQYKKYPIPKLD